MERIISDAHAHVEPEPSSVAPVAGPAPLNIRWRRTAMAAVGLLALLTAGISGALNVFNIGSASLSVAGLVIFLAVLAGLRALAIRDQNARRSAAHAAAERSTADAASAAWSGPAVEQRETVLFDGAEGAEPGPVQKPLTADELRNAALRVAAKGTEDAKLAHTQTLAEGELDAETWEPVEVPKPGYVTAARAAAAQVAPLAVPEVPKSTGTSIKADQAGIGVPATGDSAPVPVIVEGKSAEEAPAAAPAPSAAVKPADAAHGLNNLDVVLQRRRA
ncbi:hypothetical protein CVV68_10585 [Arthrobacter livingstonensis]|uniref:Uncharacterized protein n=1 Tax=Arthrobacter livingstonensis TaxID=670078 RepID=A0A2V5LUV0_9MICC|nr:hypothetical protein [Arthrobacter livingstonensis]PYI67187.1 hypothetical protein CVV68_10585 [Arthrobacter livingstonensis]